jgi:hypothetical protein
MTMRSEIDRRARDAQPPRQCASDYGMHKDAPVRKAKKKPRATALGEQIAKWDQAQRV